MPYPEAHVESSLPQLGNTLRTSLEGAGLADFLRRSLQIRDLRCALGLPRAASASVSQRYLSGPHVFVRLGSGAHFDATFCEVAVPVEQAQQLVDRVLGGRGRGAVPSKAGLPNAAECGVLAYFAARCVRACGADLRVQDVTSDGHSAQLAQGVLWPVRILAKVEARGSAREQDDDLKLDLKLLFRDLSCSPAQRVHARLTLGARLDKKELCELRTGDLLVADGWSLHVTAGGLSGLLELTVLGSDERVLVALEHDAIRLASAPLSARAHDTAELVVSELNLEFAQLARLLADESLACSTPSAARLVLRGEELARGRLVRFAGQLALEVEAHDAAQATGAEAHSTR